MAASDSITVPGSATTYTASFKTQCLLTTTAVPAAGGSITGGGYYDSGATANLVATPNTGYAFGLWTGVTSATNSASINISAPQSVSATFLLTQASYSLTREHNSKPRRWLWWPRLHLGFRSVLVQRRPFGDAERTCNQHHL